MLVGLVIEMGSLCWRRCICILAFRERSHDIHVSLLFCWVFSSGKIIGYSNMLRYRERRSRRWSDLILHIMCSWQPQDMRLEVSQSGIFSADPRVLCFVDFLYLYVVQGIHSTSLVVHHKNTKICSQAYIHYLGLTIRLRME